MIGDDLGHLGVVLVSSATWAGLTMAGEKTLDLGISGLGLGKGRAGKGQGRRLGFHRVLDEPPQALHILGQRHDLPLSLRQSGPRGPRFGDGDSGHNEGAGNILCQQPRLIGGELQGSGLTAGRLGGDLGPDQTQGLGGTCLPGLGQSKVLRTDHVGRRGGHRVGTGPADRAW